MSNNPEQLNELKYSAKKLKKMGYVKQPGDHGPDGEYDYYAHPHGHRMVILKTNIKEDIEQINELSDDKLRAYNRAATSQHADLSKKRGRKSAVTVKTMDKRKAGVAKANKKLYDRRMAEHDKLSVKTHAAFKEAAHNALTDAGYELTHPGKASNLYTKHDPETNNLFVAKHHFGHPETQDSRHYNQGEIHFTSSNGTSSNVKNSGASGVKWDLRDNPDLDLVSHHEKGIKEVMNRHHEWSKRGVLNSTMNESYEIDGEFDSLDETVDLEEADATSRENLLKYQSPARKKWIQDQIAKQKAKLAEAEQIDELSRNTLSSYKKKAWQPLTKPTDIDKAAKRLDSIGKATKKLGEETLEEGRGRPRKDGTKNEADDREHIIMQLRKHISLRGAKPIKFADGTSHKISEGHARAALVLHQNLKSSIEKGNFEKKLDASHESFQAAIKSPETAGNETPKHGITLPALDRLKRMKFASGE